MCLRSKSLTQHTLLWVLFTHLRLCSHHRFLYKSVNEMKFHLFKVDPKEMDDGVQDRWEEGGKYFVESLKVTLLFHCL